jgi:large subunit ribosomal protein L4
MKIQVKSLANKKVKEIELPESVFGYPLKQHLIHVAVQAYLAGLRSGTHQTKTRGEVRGSGKKLWKQKGTGRARVGSVRSPLWRHGGTTFGPQPRDYSKDLSAGEKKNALKSVLSQKFAEESIVVVESLDLSSHKTKDFAASLAKLGVTGKALLVDQRDNENLTLAARNNPVLKTVDAMAVNVYDVLDRHHLVVSERALGRLVEVLAR